MINYVKDMIIDFLMDALANYTAMHISHIIYIIFYKALFLSVLFWDGVEFGDCSRGSAFDLPNQC